VRASERERLLTAAAKVSPAAPVQQSVTVRTGLTRLQRLALLAIATVLGVLIALVLVQALRNGDALDDALDVARGQAKDNRRLLTVVEEQGRRIFTLEQALRDAGVQVPGEAAPIVPSALMPDAAGTPAPGAAAGSSGGSGSGTGSTGSAPATGGSGGGSAPPPSGPAPAPAPVPERPTVVIVNPLTGEPIGSVDVPLVDDLLP
jgi:uncharacterized membrane protein YgcG